MLESYWRSWGHDLDQEITNVTESESTKGALEKIIFLGLIRFTQYKFGGRAYESIVLSGFSNNSRIFPSILNSHSLISIFFFIFWRDEMED